MDILNREDLHALATHSADPSITITMPTVRIEAERAQNAIRLKNLLRRAGDELRDAGVRDEQSGGVLQAGRDLLEDDDFWRGASDGLALFLSEDDVRAYRLPADLDERVVVSERFYVKPLFPLVLGDRNFYLLALSRNTVQVFKGTRYTFEEIETTEIPTSLAEALFTDDPEKSLQFHTGVKMNQGRQDAIFHGHGHPGEDFRARPQDALRRFFQQIDEGLGTTLNGDDAPLVLAGVAYYLPIYREVNTYKGLVADDLVPGNWEHVNRKEIHRRAWEVVEPVFDAERGEAMERLRHLHNNGGNLASSTLRDIVPAAVFHRIDTLFLRENAVQWGRFDPDENTIELHEDRKSGDEDLLDLAAVHTFLNGGSVYLLPDSDMPVDADAAATFRYEPGAPAQEISVEASVSE